MGTFLRDYWEILVVAVLGALAVYLLLPRPRRWTVLPGALLGAAAVVLAGVWLVKAGPVLPETVLFYAFAGIAVVSGGLMISQSTPVHAALSFALVVLSTCGLFLLQAAPFLMAATIIIYAGAIVVTFLFVIMLAQQSGVDSADLRSREPLLSSIAGFVLLAALLCVLHRSYDLQPRATAARALEPALVRVDAASRAADVGAMREILGADAETLRDLQGVLEDVRESAGEDADLAALARDVDDADTELLDVAWAEQKPDALRARLAVLYQKGMRLRNRLYGVLQAPDALPGPDGSPVAYSSFSGTPPNVAPPRDRHGNSSLPADNVTALGRSLFTDYLVPVELAATLLLVATIGAIAIAGRRSEGGLK